jgi:hypothetical protein
VRPICVAGFCHCDEFGSVENGLHAVDVE